MQLSAGTSLRNFHWKRLGSLKTLGGEGLPSWPKGVFIEASFLFSVTLRNEALSTWGPGASALRAPTESFGKELKHGFPGCVSRAPPAPQR